MSISLKFNRSALYGLSRRLNMENIDNRSINFILIGSDEKGLFTRRRMMRACFLLLSLCWFAVAAFAESNVAKVQSTDRFVYYSYNVESVNKRISDAQCQAIYDKPVYYTIVDDKPTYEQSEGLMVTGYERLQTTFVDKEHYMFLERHDVTFLLNGKTQKAKNIAYFRLDRSSRSIKGGWYSPGFCKGNLIGVQLGLNKWHHT